MQKLKLKATPRKELGRKVKKLRAEGLVPANIFGRKVESVAISIDAKEFEKLFKDAGETTLIDLELGKSTKAVLIRNVQVHPVEGQTLHVDFQQVDLKAKVTAQIPVEIVGESPAEKQGLGTVVKYIDEIEVEALPTELPEKFEISATELAEVDQTIYIKDIKVDKAKVEIKDDLEKIIAKVEPLRKEEEVVAPEPVEGEVPAEGAGVPSEGEPAKTEETKPDDSKPEGSAK